MMVIGAEKNFIGSKNTQSFDSVGKVKNITQRCYNFSVEKLKKNAILCLLFLISTIYSVLLRNYNNHIIA